MIWFKLYLNMLLNLREFKGVKLVMFIVFLLLLEGWDILGVEFVIV